MHIYIYVYIYVHTCIHFPLIIVMSHEGFVPERLGDTARIKKSFISRLQRLAKYDNLPDIDVF